MSFFALEPCKSNRIMVRGEARGQKVGRIEVGERLQWDSLFMFYFVLRGRGCDMKMLTELY